MFTTHVIRQEQPCSTERRETQIGKCVPESATKTRSHPNKIAVMFTRQQRSHDFRKPPAGIWSVHRMSYKHQYSETSVLASILIVVSVIIADYHRHSNLHSTFSHAVGMHRTPCAWRPLIVWFHDSLVWIFKAWMQRAGTITTRMALLIGFAVIQGMLNLSSTNWNVHGRWRRLHMFEYKHHEINLTCSYTPCSDCPNDCICNVMTPISTRPNYSLLSCCFFNLVLIHVN